MSDTENKPAGWTEEQIRQLDATRNLGTSDIIKVNSLLMSNSGAARMERSTDEYRLGMMPNGVMVLQRAFTWTKGKEGGVTWRTLPLVRLDMNGNEALPNAPGAKNE